jgi:hypothetical protein
VAAVLVIFALVIFLIAHASQPNPAAAPDTTTPVPAAAAPAQAQQAPAPAAPAAVAPAQPQQAPAPAAPAAAAPPPAAAAQPPIVAQPAPVSSGANAAALPIVAPIPTLTPFPNTSAGANTPAGTALQIGQPWRQDGLALSLAATQASASGVSMNFLMTNTRPNQVAQRFSRNQVFSATDNTNAPLTLVDPGYAYNLTVPPNSTAIFDSAHEGGPISFSGNLTDPRLTSITVIVASLGGITNAKWTIPIQR